MLTITLPANQDWGSKICLSYPPVKGLVEITVSRYPLSPTIICCTHDNSSKKRTGSPIWMVRVL